MAQITESDILAALNAYRARIADANHSAMLKIIPQIKKADMEDPELWESPEEEEAVRLEFVHNLVGASEMPQGNTRPPIERVSDVLDKWDLIVQQLALDGASVNPDTEWRAARRDLYHSAILEGLRSLPCPTGQWALPHDFKILMRHVNSLEGHGWRRLRYWGKLIFWEGWGPAGASEDRERIKRRVTTGQTIKDQIVELKEFDVAGGWACGTGNESICYVVYTRPTGNENHNWSWRYVASLGQFGNEIFDDIVAVLEWYVHIGLPNDNDLDISAEEVFQP